MTSGVRPDSLQSRPPHNCWVGGLAILDYSGLYRFLSVSHEAKVSPPVRVPSTPPTFENTVEIKMKNPKATKKKRKNPYYYVNLKSKNHWLIIFKVKSTQNVKKHSILVRQFLSGNLFLIL